MVLEFRTLLTGGDIELLNTEKIIGYNEDSDEEVCVDSIIIVWQIEFELREWGIKSMVFYVKAFEFDAYQDGCFNINFQTDKTWKAEILTDNMEVDTIRLSDCSIDFETGIINIY